MKLQKKRGIILASERSAGTRSLAAKKLLETPNTPCENLNPHKERMTWQYELGLKYSFNSFLLLQLANRI